MKPHYTKLQGSEKQITWASEIRDRICNEIGEALERVNKGLTAKPTPENEAMANKFNQAAERIARQSKAGWWIGCKDVVGSHLVKWVYETDDHVAGENRMEK